MMRSKRRGSSVVKQRLLAVGAALSVAALIFVGANVIFALTANVDVQPSYTGNVDHINQPNDLRPQECIDNGVSVSKVVTGSGSSLQGDNSGDLLLAGNSTASIVGGSGDDCIVGGAAATIDGGGGNDVCIGSQTVVFTNCEVTIRQ